MALLLFFSPRCPKPFPVLCKQVNEHPCGPVLGSGVVRSPWEPVSCFFMCPECQEVVVISHITARSGSLWTERLVLQHLACRSLTQVAKVATSLSASGAARENELG